MLLRPFPALRPTPQKAAQVSAVPYDVVNREEAAQLAEGNPLSFLHVSRPEIDLDPKTDPHGAPVYAQAQKALAKLKAEAPLVVENEPMLYLYRLKQGSHVQTGIAATFSVEEYDAGGIAKHEKTRPDKEDDRTRHMLALGAQTGPAYLAYRGLPEIDERVARITSHEMPLFDFTAPDGVTHTIWAVRETAPFVEAFKRVPRLYIADGHHRSASASRAHAELGRQGAAGGARSSAAAHAFFLAVAFPAEELRILPYHRVVRDLRGLSAESVLKQVSERFHITENASPEPKRGEFAMYLHISGRGRWVGLKPKMPPKQPPAQGGGIAGLDVSVLQDQLLAPILGIQDPRTDARIDFVGGIRGAQELERRVDRGQAAVAFALHPTTLEDVMSVSDAGGIMPPKSTWFEPKLRDGLLSHVIA
jgi:uncharacterized protein (DUF1015 family)